MIDITQAPYFVKADVYNSTPGAGPGVADLANATDNWEPLQELAFKMGERMAADGVTPDKLHPDRGGTIGGTIWLPPGSMKVGHKLVLPYGVALQGDNDYASALIPGDTINPAHHFIDIGDADLHLATFGGKVKNLNVWCPMDMPADTGAYAIYSNNMQDTAYTVEGVRIYGGQRGGLMLQTGYGGSTVVRVNNVMAQTAKSGQWCVFFNFGAGTMVEVNTVQCATRRKSLDPNHPDFNKPLDSSYGMFIGNGRYDIKRIHYEQVQNCTVINQTINGSVAEVMWHTRGELSGHQITINNGSLNNNNIALMHVEGYPDQPGSYTVLDGRPGKSHLTGHILERTKF